MKKLFVLIIIFMSAAVFAKVPKQLQFPEAYKDGDWAIQAGAGWGMGGVAGDIVVPPIILTAERAVALSSNNFPFAFGGVFSFSKNETVFYDYTYLYFAFRTTFHFNFDVKGMDLYAGLITGVSYRVDGEKTDLKAKDGGLFPQGGGFIGIRYFFTEMIGVYSELGYGPSVIQAGVVFKI